MTFSGSRAFGEAFEILKSRFGVLIGTTLIFWVGLMVVMGAFGGSIMASVMASASTGADPDPAQIVAGMGFSIVLLYLLVYALQFAMAIAMVRLCSDRHAPSIGDAISTGVRGVPTMFGVVIILAVAGVIGGVLIGMVVGGLAAVSGSEIVSGLLMIAAFLGGLYLYARLSMLTPVIAIEDERNPIQVIRRSWAMTGPAALKIVLVVGLAAVLAGLAVFALLFATIGTAALSGQPPSIGGMVAFVVAMIAFGLTVGLYFTALIAAIHRQLSGGAVAATSDTFT
jgi:hypothetical protein